MTRITMAVSALGLLMALSMPTSAQSVGGATIKVVDGAAIVFAEIGATPQGANVSPAEDAGDTSPPYPTEPAPAAPALTNPVTGFMEAGQIIVTLSTTRSYAGGPSVNFGYRTGQLIPVTIVISADPHVLVDIGALNNMTLHKDGSKFEMAAPPVVTSDNLNGKKITIIQLVVRTWEIESVVPFNCQFHYATGYLPDKKTPDWKPATTPDFLISMSRTATESSQDLLPGDVSAKHTAAVWWSKPLELGGALVMLLVPLWLAYKYWLIRRNASMATRSQKAWNIIGEVLRQRADAGHEEFTAVQLQLISATLREYLAIESLPTILTHAPLEEFFQSRADGAELKTLTLSALSKLDRAVYSQSRLTPEETNALIQEISRIIPRD